MRLLTAVSGVRVPQQAPSERNRNAVSFLFIVSFSTPLTLFSPCTTPACRSVGENTLFRRALRSLRGSSPLAGAIVAARRTSQHLAQQRGVFACMPALNPTENSFGGDPDLCPTENAFGGGPDAPLRVAKMQDVCCAPRSYGTIAPLSHFCSARRLRRGFFLYRFFLEPPDAVIPHRKYFRRGPRLYPTENTFDGDPDLCPTENTFGGDPGFMPHKTYVLRGPRTLPHRKYFRRGPRFYAPQNIRFAGTLV